MWPWKVYLTILGAVLSLAVAVIPTLYGVAWWITAPVILAIGSIVASKSSDRVYIADVFKDWKVDQKNRVATLIRIAVGVHVLWSIVYVVNPSWFIYLLVTLPIISGIIYGGARNEEYHIAHAKPDEEKPAVGEAFEDRQAVKKARTLLDTAGHPRVRILSFKMIGDPTQNTGGKQIEVQIPTTGMGK